MLTATELSQVLRENGCKVTPQRLAIYDMLANTKEHPTAEAIYKRLRPEYPAMSLATVYKSVEVLNKINVIQMLNVGEDSYRYDANINPHAHVKCTHCGKVVDMEEVDTAALTSKVAKETGFTVEGQQLYFYGICPTCQKRH